MEELAKHHRVLWVNSIAIRTPNLTSGNDLKKILRKIREWFRGAKVIHDRLRVFTPISLPLPNTRIAQALNRWLVITGVRRAARSWGLQTPQFWTFVPNVVDFVGHFGESKVIYYCIDEWTSFTHLNPDYIRKKESELIAKSDTVFVSSENLLRVKRLLNPRTHLIPHGVNHSLFARALDKTCNMAAELCNLRRPVIGCLGNLFEYFDQEFVAEVARLRPNWSLVIVGKIMTNANRLQEQPNIHLMKAVPYERLPEFCRGLDAGFVAYKPEHPFSQNANPLKLREYLAAGLPVVALDIPAAHALGVMVSLVHTPLEFVSAVEQLLFSDSADKRRARSARMKSESWTARVAEIERILDA